MTITPLLAEARAAIAKREPSDALAPLLRAWASVRAPALAGLIERISDSLQRTRPPIGGPTQSEIEDAWRARAKHADAGDLGVLLACVAETDSHKARKRLKLIANHAPDPRLASTLVGLILAPPYNTPKFWQTVHELLLACADPRALDRLEQVVVIDHGSSTSQERFDAARRRTIVNLRAQLPELRLELVGDELAELLSITTELDRFDANQHDPGPELLAAIFENPQILEHRQVYADYLLGIGDVRGEFIALQLADLRGELRSDRGRMNLLLGENLSVWVGPIGPLLVRSGTRFEAGFLSVARLKQTSRSFEPLLENPIWATVTRLEQAPIGVVSAPIMRSLRSLSWTVASVIAAGRESPALPSVTELHIERTSSQRYDTQWARRIGDARSVLEEGALLPALKRVRFDADARSGIDEHAWLWAGRLGQRLERIELHLEQIEQRTGVPHLRVADYVRSVSGVESDTLREVEIRHATLGCRIVRSAGSTRVELTPGPNPDPRPTADVREALERITGIELVLDPRLGLP
jgi:uncharacterized protein (TIGR02996 family)